MQKETATLLTAPKNLQNIIRAISKKYCLLFERHCYLIILLAIFPGFILASPKYSVNIFRIFGLLPFIVYCLVRPGVFPALKNIIQIRIFLFFCFYSLASIFWGAGELETKNLLLKVASTCTLPVVIYFSIKNHQNFIDALPTYYFRGGSACLLLTIFTTDMHLNLEHIVSGYGFFNFHVYISWLIGCLCLLLVSNKPRLSYLEQLVLIFFFVSMIMSQGRGGILVFACGYAAMLYYQRFPIRNEQVIACFMVTMILILLFRPHDVGVLFAKGMSERIPIWHNAYEKVTYDIHTVIFGYGLNTDTENIVGSYVAPHYHSIYWSMFYGGGIILLSTYILMLGYVIRDGIKYLPTKPWPYMVIGMSAALVFDGSRFFVYPSAFFSCFLLPFFITLFSRFMEKQ